MKNYYLVVKEKNFVSDGGEVDVGGYEKLVEYTDKYNHLIEKKLYIERYDSFEEYPPNRNQDDLDEEFDEDDLEDEFWYDNKSMDGYNSEVTLTYVEKLTKEKYDKYFKIIKDYNSL